MDTFKGFSIHEPIDTCNSNRDGVFALSTNYPNNINLIISYVGFVPVTIKNIELEKNTNKTDLGSIHLLYRVQWVEAYDPPEGETKKETQKKLKEWRKNNETNLVNRAGYSPDFFELFEGMDTIFIDCPQSGTKKEFQIKDESLIIDDKEFISE